MMLHRRASRRRRTPPRLANVMIVGSTLRCRGTSRCATKNISLLIRVNHAGNVDGWR
jgi:hypothetical protein